MIVAMAALDRATREAMMWRYIQESRGERNHDDRRTAIDFPCSSLWQAFYADQGLAYPVGDMPRAPEPHERPQQGKLSHISMVLPAIQPTARAAKPQPTRRDLGIG